MKVPKHCLIPLSSHTPALIDTKFSFFMFIFLPYRGIRCYESSAIFVYYPDDCFCLHKCNIFRNSCQLGESMLMLIAGVSNVMFLHNTLNTLSVHSELDQKFRRNCSVLVLVNLFTLKYSNNSRLRFRIRVSATSWPWWQRCIRGPETSLLRWGYSGVGGDGGKSLCGGGNNDGGSGMVVVAVIAMST